jgi:3-oxoacyl-[acyl-carrier protein] reductase
MFTSIAGKSLVVTGGSKGIGKGIAQVFAAKGAKVLLTGRHAEAGNAVVDEITDAGGTAAFFEGDVSSWHDMQEMASRAIELHGGIDILCANAGISGEEASIAEMTPDVWNEAISVNLTGSFLAVRACLSNMIERGSGRIILTSSITGPLTAIPHGSHYGASKAGQLGMMRTAALELAQSGITVNAIMPGNIMTPAVVEAGAEYIRQMTATVPMKKLGTAEDIAYAALYFASDEAGYVTGQTLIVDGGQVLPEALTD